MYLVYFINLILLTVFFSFSKMISLKLNLYKKSQDNTPIVGGLGIYLFFNLSVIMLIFFEDKLTYNQITIIFLMSLVFLIGLIDDIFDISYNIRLLSIFIVILIFLKFNDKLLVTQLYFETFNKTFLIGNLTYFLTPLFIMLLLNSLNMVDGINGNSGLIFLSFFLLTFNNQSELNLFLLLIVISLVVFLFFNFKNYTYIGDSGIYFISIFLSLYLIDSYNSHSIDLSCEKIFLILMIPGIDMFRLFCVRIYNRSNPFKGDKNHLHHLLIQKLKLQYTLLVYIILILWPFIFKIYFNINILFLILTNIFIYSFLIFKLKKIYK